MKMILAPLICAAALAAGAFAAELPATQRFYGKVVSVDPARRAFVVHNTKQKLDAAFQWNDKTTVTSNKKVMPASDLKVGQSLIVSYQPDNDVNRATKVTVRTPFKRASQTE